MGGEEVGVGGASGVWESSACVKVGDPMECEGGTFLATFRRGEGAFSVVRVGMSITGVGVSCLRFARTSEKVRTGAGGVFQTDDWHTEGLGGGDFEVFSEGVGIGLSESELVLALLGG